MLPLLDLCARIDAGRLTPEGAVGLAREAIAAREPEVGALVCVDPAPAIPAGGPLAGIAVGIKDIIDTADLPTRMGSAIYEDWRPRADAPVARLKRLGAVPLAKTTTTPFAFLDPTATRNPHHPGHTPRRILGGLGRRGGGRDAAAGARHPDRRLDHPPGGVLRRRRGQAVVPAAADGGGEVLFLGPRHARPVRGGRGGCRPRPGAARRPAGHRPPRRWERARIGILRQDFCAAPEAEAEAALARAAQAAERAGATIRDLTLPARFGEAYAAHGTLQDYEARQALAWEYAAHRDALPPRLRAALDAAQGIETAAYDEARRTAHHARRGLKDVFSGDGVDVLLTYAAPGAAPSGLDHTGDSRFNRLWTLMGVPCVTLPVDRTPAGLPVGVQVIARFGDDGRALAAAGLIERALRE